MKYLLLLASILSFSACTMNEKPDGCIRIDVSEIVNTPEKVLLTSWAKSVKYIPLETNDSVLIRFISHISLIDDKLLIQYQDRCSLFDLSGKYIRDIARKGEGPDEYISADELLSDKNGIRIVSQNKIKSYNWQGKCTGIQTIPNVGMRDILSLKGTDVMLGHIPNISGSEKNRIHFFRDTTILHTLPYTKSFPKGEIAFVFYDECRAIKMNDGICAFKEIFNDTLFTVSKDYKLTPAIYFDLGKYKVAEDARYTLNDPRKSIFDNKLNLSVVGESGHTLYMYTYMNKQEICLYYDKKEGKAHSALPAYPPHTYAIPDGKIFIPRTISNDGKYLISYENQESDDNPVVVLVER